jgi:uncharacterized membrane protein
MAAVAAMVVTVVGTARRDTEAAAATADETILRVTGVTEIDAEIYAATDMEAAILLP